MDKPSNSPSSSKIDRKTIERNRRNEMKTLFTKLNSLVPHQQGSISREHMALSDQLEVATKYIKDLQGNLTRLKNKKSNLLGTYHSRHRSNTTPSSEARRSKSPQIQVHVKGNSALEVLLITDLDSHAIFNEAIRVLHDEGVEIVNASFSVVDDISFFHTIHAKIDESTRGQGAVGRITERLKRFSLN